MKKAPSTNVAWRGLQFSVVINFFFLNIFGSEVKLYVKKNFWRVLISILLSTESADESLKYFSKSNASDVGFGLWLGRHKCTQSISWSFWLQSSWKNLKATFFGAVWGSIRQIQAHRFANIKKPPTTLKAKPLQTLRVLGFGTFVFLAKNH